MPIAVGAGDETNAQSVAMGQGVRRDIQVPSAKFPRYTVRFAGVHVSSPLKMNVNLPDNERRAYLTFAVALTQTSRAIIAQQRARGFTTDLKADASVVTAVDLAVEEALRREIAAYYPDHGIRGEELPARNPTAPFQWILDPIDGTDNFAHGIPTFGTIIALHYRGQPLIGVLDHPDLQRTYSAGRGLGAFCNGRTISVMDHADASRTPIIAVTAAGNFLKTNDLECLAAIQRAFPNIRTYRDCFAHALALDGSVRAVVDVNLNLWDMAATSVLVEEAGGRFEVVRTLVRDDKTFYSVVFGAPDIVARLLPLTRLSPR